MTRRGKIIIGALSIALTASLALNVIVTQKAISFYHRMQAIRLDPLGFKSFPDPPEPARERTILFFGDSRSEQWPAPDGLEGLTFINRGIGYQTTAQIINRFQTHVIPAKPEIIILQLGVNDLKTIPLFPDQKETIINDCKSNIRRIVEMSVQSGARVILTTIFPLGQVPLERRPFWSDDVPKAITEVNAYLETLAGERVTVIKTGPLLANAQGIADPKYSHDLLHLKRAGYTPLNAELRKILSP